jgi:hypothetical protein
LIFKKYPASLKATKIRRCAVGILDGDQKMGWHMSVREMPHKEGFSYPVFEWSYGAKDGIRGGELRAWPLQRALVFETRRGEGPYGFDTVEEVMETISKYGWGEPPHIKEVWETIMELPHPDFKDIKLIKKISAELNQKWEALLQ